jgi:anaerobic selenocysteine-containing dehydrogenase
MAEALGIEAVSRFGGLPLEASPTTCALCDARCGILGFLKNGHLRGLLGNPNDPNSRGRICIRGLAGMNLQEDEERLLYPMARQGRRGEGRWRRITWDEAFQHLADILGGSGKDQVLVQTGQRELLTERFLKVLGARREVTFLDGRRSWSADAAHRLTWGAGRGVPDVLRARTILNFGSNPYDHHELYVPFVQRLIEARAEKEAKLISFDVRLSETAGLSDEWVPVEPGSDVVVALALAHVILESGLHDSPFVERWTNCTEERLRGHLAPYTPERAQEISGVDAGAIRRIAVEFATRGPSVAFSGGGVSGQAHGTEGERAVLLLNAIVGSIDQPGGYCLPKAFTFQEPDPPHLQGMQIQEMSPPKALRGLLEGSFNVDLYLIYKDNPAYRLPQSHDIRKILRSRDRISNLIVMDTHVTETAAVADLVIPAATYLESWGIESRPSMEMIPFVGLRQPILAPVSESERLRQARINRFDRPVTRPMGEALPWDDLLLETARRMGGDTARALAFKGVEEYIEKLLSQIPSLMEDGGLAHLRRNGVWNGGHQRPVYGSYLTGGFRTKSGRLEIYSEALAKQGFSPLPSYDMPEKRGVSGLTLVPYRSLSSEGPPNAKWLCEIAHENPAWINEATAMGLGLVDGDRIEIISLYRRAEARVRTTQGIHPGVIAISRGLGHWGYGHFAEGAPFKGADPDAHLIWWQKQGNGAHIEPLVLIRLDPISGGQAWMDTVVKIEML